MEIVSPGKSEESRCLTLFEHSDPTIAIFNNSNLRTLIDASFYAVPSVQYRAVVQHVLIQDAWDNAEIALNYSFPGIHYADQEMHNEPPRPIKAAAGCLSLENYRRHMQYLPTSVCPEMRHFTTN
ncbi:hypothetical protein EG329_004848 [Mollisiaceae sp. DMI_Dod_QoI]|nr:hypothetical protein EG329_004848 [Helotiales sp. DMI_Dod_QoI]